MRRRLGWRRRLWRMFTRAYFHILLIDALAFLAITIGGGRREANAHPYVRSGASPWGRLETRPR